MLRVLFVCLGNICRSPMAEAVFREKVNQTGLSKQFFVDSAGTGDWHIGEMPHKGTQEILKKHQISFENMKARQLQSADFQIFSYIFTMDDQNTKDLAFFQKESLEDRPLYQGRLLDFVNATYKGDIPDPYFTGNFDLVYKILSEACEKALDKIRKLHQL